MVPRWTVVALVLFVFSGLIIGGCSKKEQVGDGEKKTSDTSNNKVAKVRNTKAKGESPLVRALEHFPMLPDTTWTYKIILGEAEPLFYEEVRWPQGEGDLIFANSGRFVGAIKEENKGKELSLVLKIKGLAKKQGGLQYPMGLELDVVKDDLMVFHEAKNLYFAGTPDRFMFHQVVVHDGSMSPAGSMGIGNDGYSMRIFFFASSSSSSVSMGKDPKDSLFFTGTEKIPGSQEEGLHFIRKVLAREGDNELSGAFTEDTWFAKGKGLVRLEQKRDGKTAMTWVLKEFSK